MVSGVRDVNMHVSTSYEVWSRFPDGCYPLRTHLHLDQARDMAAKPHTVYELFVVKAETTYQVVDDE